jgi:hypothetical protein
MQMRIGYGLMLLGTVAALGGCERNGTEQSGDPLLDAEELRSTVVVNPQASGHGVARTIRDALAMVAPGGKILVKPGTYDERVVISKGVTLQGSDVETGAAVIRQIRTGLPAPATEGVIHIETEDPVVLRDLTVRQDNIRGITNVSRVNNLSRFYPVDLTVERVSFEGISNLTPIVGNGVTVTNNVDLTGSRARLTVRESRFAVGGVGISLGGDVDAVIEQNRMDHVMSRSLCLVASPTGQGANATVSAGAQINIEIRNNVFANCGTDAVRFPGRGFNAIAIQGAANVPTTGTVNIIGNIFQTTPAVPGAPDACPAGAILYEAYSGVIEHNTVLDVVQDCTPEPLGPRNQAGAIYIGSRIPGIPAADVSVRFNDVAGNAYAGLRLGSNQLTSIPIDATCNWWGHPTGPSGTAPGGGDAVVVEAGATAPTTIPFATAPIAGTAGTECAGGL